MPRHTLGPCYAQFEFVMDQEWGHNERTPTINTTRIWMDI